ncbi:MAG: DUF2125 domain-containing protein [Pseudomonadota bacterium]
MKKLMTIGAGVIALGAAGWAGLWFLGKGEVERRVELELARLQSQGWTITEEAREVEGFPFGYAVNFTNFAAVDAETGVLVRLPQVTVSAEPTAPDQLRFDLPETFQIDVPVPEERRKQDVTLPKILQMKGEARDFAVIASGAPGQGRTIDALAAELKIALDQADFPGAVWITIDGLDGGMTDQAGADTAVSRIKADTLQVRVEDEGSGEGGKTSTAAFRYEAISMTASTDLSTPEALYEAIYGGADGQLDGAFQTGAIHTTMTAGSAEDPEGGTFTYTAKSSTGIYVLESGGIDIKGEARDNTWQMEANNPASPVEGLVSVRQVQARYRMPMSPSEIPGDMAIRLELSGLNMNDATWASLDPKGVLPREPADLVLDLEGTVRVTKRFDTLREGEAPPFELANLIVKDIAVSALGASAKAAGDVEMVQPVNAPQGQLQVEFSGAQALLTALSKAGLLPEEMAQMGDAMLKVYARPTGEEDGWRTEVSFATDGISVNGLPVQ